MKSNTGLVSPKKNQEVNKMSSAAPRLSVMIDPKLNQKLRMNKLIENSTNNQIKSAQIYRSG